MWVSVCISVSNCVRLIVTAQYITWYLVHSPRQLVMVTEGLEHTETMYVSRSWTKQPVKTEVSCLV